MARHLLPDGEPHENPITEDYRESVKEAHEAKERYKRSLQSDMRKFLSTDYGVRIFRRIFLIARGNAASTALDSKGDLCPYGTFKNEGRRAVWLELAAMMHPDDLKKVFASQGFADVDDESESEDT